MNYEKKYKEALKKAKDNYNAANSANINVNSFKNTLIALFPELVESEDERIRKMIINTLNRDKILTEDEAYDCVTWLEKQGEQELQGKTALEAINEEKVDNQNCVKTIDKVEPKFKVGDWIIRSDEGYKHNTYLVTEVKDYYVCEELKGRRVTFTFNDVHKNFKLWDVSDAKDGDVLVDEGKPFIFKGFDRFHPNCPVAYCGIGVDDYFIVSSGDGWWTGNEKVLPATKEQRDLLFSKMKEAGYEFDSNKKDMKRIHVIDEGKSEMDHCFTKMMNGEKVSPAWSEEDEKRLISCLNILQAKGIMGVTETINTKWLKSLKERIK